MVRRYFLGGHIRERTKIREKGIGWRKGAAECSGAGGCCCRDGWRGTSGREKRYRLEEEGGRDLGGQSFCLGVLGREEGRHLGESGESFEKHGILAGSEKKNRENGRET